MAAPRMKGIAMVCVHTQSGEDWNFSNGPKTSMQLLQVIISAADAIWVGIRSARKWAQAWEKWGFLLETPNGILSASVGKQVPTEKL